MANWKPIEVDFMLTKEETAEMWAAPDHRMLRPTGVGVLPGQGSEPLVVGLAAFPQIAGAAP